MVIFLFVISMVSGGVAGWFLGKITAGDRSKQTITIAITSLVVVLVLTIIRVTFHLQ